MTIKIHDTKAIAYVRAIHECEVNTNVYYNECVLHKKGDKRVRVRVRQIKWQWMKQHGDGWMLCFCCCCVPLVWNYISICPLILWGWACGWFNVPNYQYLIKNFSAVDGFKTSHRKISVHAAMNMCTWHCKWTLFR